MFLDTDKNVFSKLYCVDHLSYRLKGGGRGPWTFENGSKTLRKEGVKKKWVPIPLFLFHRQLRHVGRAQQLFPFQPWLTLSHRDDTDSLNVKGAGNHGNPRAPPPSITLRRWHIRGGETKEAIAEKYRLPVTQSKVVLGKITSPRGFLYPPTSSIPETWKGEKRENGRILFTVNSNSTKKEGRNTRSECVPIFLIPVI